MATQSALPALVRFAAFGLNLNTGELRRDGILVRLQPQPSKALVFLVSRAGQIVTRQQLAQEVWGAETFVDFEQGLNFAIRQIRNALQDDADSPRFLETLPKRGYRFIAAVEVVAPAASTPAASTNSPSDSDKPAHPADAKSDQPVEKHLRPSGGFRRVAAGFGILLVVAAAGFLVMRKSFRPSTVNSVRSLAVLPLQNLSGDNSQEYFADGMTDELTTQLAKIRSLRVISRTSAMHYKGSHQALTEIARELHVDVVVEGSVVRDGNRIKLTAQLIDAATDRHIWADSYEREMNDILFLQNEVARSIAEQIKAQLTPAEQLQLASSKAVDPQAYEAYFKGRYFWDKRTMPDVRKALASFQEAIDRDPTYAPAYAGLANSYVEAGDYSLMLPQQAYPLAKTAALKALELDDTLAAAHVPLATIRAEYDWDFAGAEKEFQKAISLNLNDATTHQFYAEDVLEPEGRTEEAAREMALAQQLDPALLIGRAAAGYTYYLARQYDRAIEQERKTLELDPNFPKAHQILAFAYEQKGMNDEAVKEFQAAERLDGNPAYAAGLARALALAGRKKEARDTLDSLGAMSKQMYVHPYQIAYVYLGLGEKDHALDWLERAEAERCWLLIYLKVDPRFDVLRSEPRFQTLIRHLGLPE